ncbi:hypothetical protein [Cryobacterium sp. PAMC25264]|uniref:hypothetical protein n=1 Tax=Cryobacterium sp. PAMC25264 TaxID=2861288 RepID=UPI001C638CA4|nr:hypothetical protein [Cryobacterium sp. PAMC25264]QYF74757.1 hypothetical protein KY500_06225 [Cryobacterium sp. PAMC25264]
MTLAIEADVKRHVLTHRHTDLRDEFYARVKSQGFIPESERRLRQDLKTCQEALDKARSRIEQLADERAVLLRINNILGMENEELRGTHDGKNGGRVTPIR